MVFFQWTHKLMDEKQDAEVIVAVLFVGIFLVSHLL
jgi:hypothetical protein